MSDIKTKRNVIRFKKHGHYLRSPFIHRSKNSFHGISILQNLSFDVWWRSEMQTSLGFRTTWIILYLFSRCFFGRKRSGRWLLKNLGSSKSPTLSSTGVISRKALTGAFVSKSVFPWRSIPIISVVQLKPAMEDSHKLHLQPSKKTFTYKKFINI